MMKRDMAPIALALFRDGLDTAEIARQMGIQESLASRLVWYARSSQFGLPADFISPNHGADPARNGRIKRYTIPGRAA